MSTRSAKIADMASRGLRAARRPRTALAAPVSRPKALAAAAAAGADATGQLAGMRRMLGRNRRRRLQRGGRLGDGLRRIGRQQRGSGQGRGQRGGGRRLLLGQRQAEV